MIGFTLKEIYYQQELQHELKKRGMSKVTAEYIAFYRLLQNNRRKNANLPKIRRVHLSYKVPKSFYSGR